MTTFPPNVIRNAILSAADEIEARPQDYDFGSDFVGGYGECRCLWGHIGYQLGLPADTYNAKVCDTVFGKDSGRSTNVLYNQTLIHSLAFVVDPEAAVRQLRAFADKYFPAAVLEEMFDDQ